MWLNCNCRNSILQCYWEIESLTTSHCSQETPRHFLPLHWEYQSNKVHNNTTLLIIHRRILHQRPQLSPYHSKLNVSNMPKRYFSNPYTATDHTRKDVTFWKSKISQIVQEILKHQKLDRRDLGRLTYLNNSHATEIFWQLLHNSNIFTFTTNIFSVKRAACMWEQQEWATCSGTFITDCQVRQTRL